MYPVYDFHNK